MKESVIQALSALMLLCFSVLVGMVGIGFLIAGLYLGLTHWLQPAGAAAATGGLILLVTLLLLLLCKVIVSPGRKPRQEQPQDELSGLLQNAASMQRMTRQLESTVREHKPLFTAGSFAVGFYLGVNPEARRALGAALKEATAHGLREAEGHGKPAGRP
ncbi:MAG: hypothetical protein R3280_10320 [Marinobacter sp.]|uniref:hypothetical protein n=1 Tax=Marinobacter sp. TaxID=50741 RepID=UPI00299DB013|nr:hypothetical protein [Marinobacter sp.]MDX1635024.1 hypothetical protein [Marinobacter sp.]